MNIGPLRLLTIFAPAFGVYSVLIVLNPDSALGTVGNMVVIIAYSSVILSVPQIVWGMVGIFGSLSKEAYWGGLFAVQFWVIAYFVVTKMVLHLVALHSILLFYSVSCLALLIGATCGLLVRKFSRKELAA